MHSTASPIDRLLPLLKSVAKVAGENKWLACCPAHNGDPDSLMITLGKDGKPRLHCQSVCTASDIMAALKVPVNEWPKLVHGPPPVDRPNIQSYPLLSVQAVTPNTIRDNLRAIAGKVKPDAPPPEPKLKSKSSATTNLSARIEPEILTMSNVAPQVVRWLWPQRIALGRISVIVGRPGEGKSFVTVDMAARLSTGRPMPGTDADTALTGDTLLLCAEDDPADTIRPRLIAADADCGRVHLLRGASLTDDDEGGKKSIAIDLSNVDIIRDTLDRFSECKLVVVDPVGSYLGGRVDAHRDNEVRAVLQPLSALAAERGVAVVLVAHTRKSQSDFADDAVLGSRAFTGIARNVHHLLTDPEDRDRRLFLPGKCNLGKRPPGLAMQVTDEPARVDWEPEPLTDVHADDMMTVQPSRGPKPESLNAAVEWLRDQLRNGPVPSEELKGRGKDAGHSWTTLRRAKDSIGIRPTKPYFSGVWVWTLPVAVAQDALEDAQNP